MQKKNKPILGLNKELALIIAAAMLIILIFASGILNRHRVWTGMTFYNLQFPAGRYEFSLDAGDAYGPVSTGPGFTLPAGNYRIKWRAENDGECILRLSAGNGAVIEPGELIISPDVWEQEAYFEIVEPAVNVQIQFVFETGTYLNVHDLRLYSPEYTDDAWRAAFLIAAVCLTYILQSRRCISRKGWGRLVVMGTAVLIASAPTLRDPIMYCYDTPFHMARIMNLADALKQGQIPARLGSYSYNGYGAITSAMYPDLFLYPFALMIVGGANIAMVINAIMVFSSVLSAVSMYVCARRIFEDEDVGMCASVLYVLASYRLVNMYSRCAVGELLAMAVLPFFVMALWEVFCGQKEKWALLGLAAWAVLMTHIVSTLICAVAAAAMFVLFLPKLLRERRMGAVIKAALLALGLSAFFLVPFIHYSLQNIGAAEIFVNPSHEAKSLAQLFMWGGGDMPVDPINYKLSGQAIELGMPLVLGAALMIYLWVSGPDGSKREKRGLFFAGLGGVFALMTTTLFPWNYAYQLTGGLVGFIQFPTRLLGLADLCLAMTCGYAFMRVAGNRRDGVMFGILALCMVTALPIITEETQGYSELGFAEGSDPLIDVYREYQLPGTDVTKTNKQVLADDDVAVTAYEKKHSDIRAQVTVENAGVVSFPIFGFDGYAAELNGERIDWTLGDNNRLTVHLPAGAEGELHVWFEGKSYWRIADVVSLLTLIGLGIFDNAWKKGENG